MSSESSVANRVRQAADEVRAGWTPQRYGVLLFGILLAAGMGPRFQVFLLTEFMIVALFALGFNLLFGYTGLLSFGHGMFYAGGAYGLAIVLKEVGPAIEAYLGAGLSGGVSLLIGAIVGILLVTIIAVPVGWLSVRMEEIYFALITLAFGMLVYSTIIQNPLDLTNGTDGIVILLGNLNIAGLEVRFGARRTFYYLTLTIFALLTFGMYRVINSPFGMVCQAIRESPERTGAIGVDVRRHRWAAFIISAVFVGVAGVLRAGLAGVASPELSHWSTSAIAVIATVIGGASFFAGPIIGAFVFLYLRWGISRVPTLEAYWEFFFGLLIIGTVLYFKAGATGGLLALRGRASDLLKARAHTRGERE